jgi:DNA-binding MarR family transcriptional regulator
MSSIGNPDSATRSVDEYDLPDDLEVRAWVETVRAYHRVTRRLEQGLDAHGLTLAQFEVLAHLHFGGRMRQSELAQRLLVSKGNVCGLIDRLGIAGLVERRADEADRRANRLVLTAVGQALFLKVFPTHIDLIKQLMGGLGAADLSAIAGGMNRVAAD